MITEDHLEQLALTWFQETGWSYLPGGTIAPDAITSERADYGVVVLKARLAAAVARLNPKLPAAAIEDVVHIAITSDHPSLIQSNRAFHRMLTDGVKIEYTNAKGEKDTDFAQLASLAAASSCGSRISPRSIAVASVLAARMYVRLAASYCLAGLALQPDWLSISATKPTMKHRSNAKGVERFIGSCGLGGAGLRRAQSSRCW